MNNWRARLEEIKSRIEAAGYACELRGTDDYYKAQLRVTVDERRYGIIASDYWYGFFDDKGLIYPRAKEQDEEVGAIFLPLIFPRARATDEVAKNTSF